MEIKYAPGTTVELQWMTGAAFIDLVKVYADGCISYHCVASWDHEQAFGYFEESEIVGVVE